MSRRGAVLEGYRVPDLTNPINPLDAQRMVSQERMHGKEMQQREAQQKKSNPNDAFKYIEENYKPNADKTNSNIIQQKVDEEMKGIHNDAFEYLKQNPNASQFEIAQMFGDRAFNTNQLYVKGRAFKENTDKAALEAAKTDAGINAIELSMAAQEQAFLDPKTGKVREDIGNIDPNDYGKYMDEAAKNKPFRVYTNQGLENHVYNPKALKTDELTTYYKGKDKSVKKERVSLTIPQDYELEKDAKGFHVVDDNGVYSVTPKSEVLPDGNKVLDQGVFERLPKSYKDKAVGEATNLVKAFNAMNGTNVHTGSVEVNTIARKFAYEDMAKMWNNGGVKRLIGNIAAPATIINNNNGGKGTGAVTINDVYQKIVDATKEGDMQFKETGKVGTRMNSLDVDAQKVIFDYIGDSDLDERNTFIVNDDGKIKVYRTPDEGEPVIDDKFLVTTLPRVGTNLKVQPSVKEKKEVVKQGEKKKETPTVPSYSKEALKKGGWTDKQIQTAVSAGKIKIN